MFTYWYVCFIINTNIVGILVKKEEVMNKKLKNALIVAGLLSLVTIPAVKADDRLIMDGAETLSQGLSEITTTDKGNGGAILNNGYDLSITGGTFSNNTLQSSNGAVFGGALYQSGGTLKISDGVVFDGNVVKSVEQTYPGWQGVDSASGGAIYITAANAVLGDVTFRNNSALSIYPSTESNGGAIFSQSNGTITMGNVVFENNSAATRGGAIYNGDSVIDIQGAASFSNNEASKGGAVYNYDVTGTTVFNTGTGSTFESNKATSSNGGAVANYDGTVNVGNNNTFSKNTAAEDGGAIYNANYSANAVTNIGGGAVFTGNSAKRGGAVYNSGTVKMDTTSGNISFNGNAASLQGADIYLDGENSSVTVEGTSKDNKVSFNDDGALAGNGTFTNSSNGTVEFIGNKNASGFTGKYKQTSGITSLNNSNMFQNFDIQGGELHLTNGSTATVDGINGILGSSIGLTVKDANSILNITNGVNIGKDSQVNILGGAQVNISNNSSLTLNSSLTRDIIESGDTWEGNITTSDGGNLTLEGFEHSTANGGGSYTQTGGSLDLNNGSDLTLGDVNSSITGGTVNVNGDNTLTVEGGSSIGGTTSTNVSGNLNINDGGVINGGTTNVKNEGNVTVGNGGSISGGNTVVENGGNVTVNQGGQINGSTNATIQSGGKVTVNGGTVDTQGKVDIQNGSELEITNGGDVTLHEGDKWEGTIINNDSNLTLDGVIHDTINGGYNQTGGSLNLENGSDLTLNDGSSIKDGEININDSNLVVENGGSITGGEITVGDNSSFNINEGGIMSGGKVDFTGDNIDIGVNGTVEEEAVFDVTNNTVVIGNTGSVSLNKDNITGDKWTEEGSIQLDGGTLNFKGTNNETNGSFLGNSGNLNISGGSQGLVIGNGSYIKDSVVTNIEAGSSLDITGGDVTLNKDDIWNGKVDISDGNLNLDNAHKNSEGSLVQTGGTTTVTGDFELNNAADSITGGEFNIGTADKKGSVTQTAGEIGADTELNITGNGKLDVQGGTTSINDNDNWDGTVNLGGGTLNLDGVTNNGNLTANGGNLNIKDSSLTIANGSNIGKDTIVDFSADSSMDIKNGGNVSFGQSSDWKGTVDLNNGGTLNVYGSSNGALHANAGNLNSDVDSTLTIGAGSYIKDEVNSNLQGSLVINGTDNDNRGEVNLGTGDTLTGDVTINNYGSLNLGDNVTMADKGQKIEFGGANAEMNLNGNNNLDLKADLVGNDGEINKNGEGNVIFSGSTSEYNGNLTINNSGNLTFVDEDGFGGNLVFGDIEGKEISIIADTVKGSTTLDKFADITYSTYRDVALKFGDTVSVSKGTITALAKEGQDVIFENDAVVSDGGDIEAIGKNVIFENGITADGNEREDVSVGVIASENAIMNDVDANNAIIGTIAGNTQFKNLKLTNSDLYIMQNGFSADSLTISGESNMNLMNGAITDNTIGNDLNISDGSVGNVTIDISARDWSSDKILAGSISTDGIGTLHVSDFQFINKCPIDREIALKIFDTDQPMENILFTATNKEVFTPIGYYRLLSQGGGVYNATLTRYNPQVFRGQVATVASYQNQLVVNNLLFDHVQQVSMQYLAEQNANKYAAAYPQFEPYQYNRKDGSLWFKSFGTFERLGMTQGLNVNNNFYGALVGADFAAIDLGKGWTLLPTAYVGYTGGHQTFANMSMYQNGGQGGVMGTFMKKDFIGSVLAYGGGYGNQMDVAGYTDDTGNWFAGTAAKAAYNFHPSKHFVIQPTALVSYNMFGQQRWHTGFGDMNMQATYLNGINVAPGINFIYGRETWSIYATIQYFYNIMGYSEGRAGHVDLPGVEMRHGFLEYGIGVTKTWKDRFSGYLQIVLRNGGRTGVGFSGGLMFRL